MPATGKEEGDHLRRSVGAVVPQAKPQISCLGPSGAHPPSLRAPLSIRLCSFKEPFYAPILKRSLE